jgi:hypothetical protein
MGKQDEIGDALMLTIEELSTPEYGWYRTDLWMEFSNTAEFCARQASMVAANPLEWSWVIIGIGRLLQLGACAAIESTSTISINCLYKKNREEHWESIKSENGNAPSQFFLEKPMELLKRTRNSEFLPSPWTIPKNKETDKWFASSKKILKYRNEFMHFIPSNWSIETKNIISLTRDSIELVKKYSQVLEGQERPDRFPESYLNQIQTNLDSILSAMTAEFPD